VDKILTASKPELIKNAAIIIDGNRIIKIATGKELSKLKQSKAKIIDASNLVAIPGFVQTHIHLCQTLFRGMAEDLQLLDWLQKKIFPFEAAHNEKSIYYTAMIGIAELIRSGTTTILDMGSVNHHEEIIRAIGETGFRAFTGKAMMDINGAYKNLKENTKSAVNSSRDLAEKWHNSYNGRVKYAPAPRFILSCSDACLKEAYEMTKNFDGMLFHTHASENKGEIQAVRERCKMDNVEFLNHLGVLSKNSVLAHCIHLSENEIQIMKDTKANIAHCPSSNLKLGSGVANIPRYLEENISVSLGADGAPCNNNLDMFQEMRLAGLIQKPIHGPTAMPVKTIFKMATIGGAKALGLENEIGTIEVGKKADIVLLDLQSFWNPLIQDEASDLYSTIVYSANPSNVDSVMIDGKWVYKHKKFVKLDSEEITYSAKKELRKLLERI
ncbi:MAG: 5'-deoxyadenosine deaminase, partial [Bacteroidetes bacterium]|nr:5'-deoxyadenosine deaminase [Bacteroidota bacterium]